jgi:hypothetical protein
MENVILQPVQQEYKDFMSLPMGIYKNLQYQNGVQGRTFFESNLCKKDGCMYYTYTTFKVKKSKSSYYRHNSAKYGFTLNEKGKLSVWFGKSIFDIPGIWNLFSYLNMNWLNSSLINYVTKTIAEKILNGKITNNTEVLKAYIKTMRLDCSPRLLLQVIEAGMYTKPHLLQMMAVAKDQNQFLTSCLNKHNSEYSHTNPYILQDLIKQAYVLERKIDYSWSENRIREEHSKWTKEIMEVEVAGMVDVISTKALRFSGFKCDGFKLLTTKKEVYAEGKEMSHCVYTNYWNSVYNGNYLVYQVDWFGERATLGCYISDEQITVNQCYRHSNRAVSSGLTDWINTIFIKSINRWAVENNIFKQELSF